VAAGVAALPIGLTYRLIEACLPEKKSE